MDKKNQTTKYSDDELIKACSDILVWKRTGYLSEDSTLKKLANEAHMEIGDAKDEVIDEAHARFKDVVLLLMSEVPYKYLKL